MIDTITIKTLAELLGISTRAVADLAKHGIVVRAGRGYALAASVHGYCDHLRKLATGRGGDENAIASTTFQPGRRRNTSN